MRNLLEETKKIMAENGYTSSDIIFIGSEETGHRCTWGEFCSLADVEYDNGYGSQEVAKDLIIVFSDGQRLQRKEYDGSEWWECTQAFEMPVETLPIRALIYGAWSTVAQINAR